LDLASKLLPFRTRFNFGLLTHIHLHASAQRRYAGAEVKQPASNKGMSKQSMVGLIESLESTVKKLNWKPAGTEWGNYYEITNYSDSAFEHKKELVSKWLEQANPRSVWDLGANTGVFSRLASGRGISTISFDIDPVAVEQNYRQVRSEKELNILPLMIDLTNPSPAIGWHNRERESLSDRGPVEMVLALALIHHLAISNNVPFPQLADFFHETGHWLIIEFVPKSDSQVQKLLSSRLDIFDHYNRDDFEHIFQQRFDILESSQVRESERFIYLMRRK
jgi:ribosomal protein L11 methylase PrmA